MRVLKPVKKTGDFLYQNGPMLVAVALYIAIYAINMDKLDFPGGLSPEESHS